MAQTQDDRAGRDGVRDAAAPAAGAGQRRTVSGTAARAAAPRKRAAARKDPPTLLPAAQNPVARVAVDIPLAHLDRPFDYLVPERLAAQARPGVRVRVRFAGQLTDGFVLERVAESEHQGRLAWLDRVTSPEVVLTDEIAGLARAVADRYAGTLADVLRLAIPPRHAATENAPARGRRMTRASGGARHRRGPTRGRGRGTRRVRPSSAPWRMAAGPRRVDRAARPGMAGGDRPGRRHGGLRRARDADRRPRRPRPGPR